MKTIILITILSLFNSPPQLISIKRYWSITQWPIFWGDGKLYIQNMSQEDGKLVIEIESR